MVEVWRQWKDSNYNISCAGMVMNRSTHQILRQQLHYKGHLKIGLSLKRKSKSFSKNFFVHRLTAECWLKKKRGCNIVNHKDGVKTNNYWTNHEWTTVSGNTKHAVQMGFIDMDYVRSCRKSK